MLALRRGARKTRRIANLYRSMPMKILTTAVLLLLSSLAVASPKLYVFDCGAINLGDVTMFGLQPDETPVRELFVPCYVIEHGNQRLLWDTGLPLNVAGQGKVDDGRRRLVRVRALDRRSARRDGHQAHRHHVRCVLASACRPRRRCERVRRIERADAESRVGFRARRQSGVRTVGRLREAQRNEADDHRRRPRRVRRRQREAHLRAGPHARPSGVADQSRRRPAS